MKEGSNKRALAFDLVRTQLLEARFRSELKVEEIPPPAKIAPHSIAFAAGVKTGLDTQNSIDSDLGTGRFILLYDPDSVEEWGSPYRVIVFAQAPLEEEIGADRLISEVAWSWLVDALDSSNAGYTNISGTATNIISTGFGGLSNQGVGCVIELRASWTPTDENFASHAVAWSQLLCSLAGFPEQEGALSIDAFRIKSKN